MVHVLQHASRRLRQATREDYESVSHGQSDSPSVNQSDWLETWGGAAEAQTDGRCCPTAGEEGAKEANDRDRNFDQIPIYWAANLRFLVCILSQTTSIVIITFLGFFVRKEAKDR